MTSFRQALQRPSGRSLPVLADCHACGTHKRCRSPKMLPVGKGNRKILILSDRPGREEDRQGKPYVGSTGRYLAEVIRKVGYDLREDCVASNAIICYSDSDNIDKEVMHCQPNVVDLVQRLKPEIIIPAGQQAVKSLLGWVWRENVGEISRWVGFQIPSQKLNAWICPTWNPAYLLRSQSKNGGKLDPILERLFEQHVASAFALEGRPWKTIPDYNKGIELLYSPAEAASAIRSFMEAGKPVAFDYETTMLKPDSQDARIFCCSISDGKRTIAYPWLGEAVQATSELLRSDVPKWGWSCKFEERWTRRILGHGVCNWKWDGMVNAHLIDNRGGVTSLKFQAFVEFGIDAYDAEVKPYLEGKGSNVPNRVFQAPLAAVLRYCAIDSLMEFKCCRKQMRDLGMTP
jgi:uracil-DNA glycosylase